MKDDWFWACRTGEAASDAFVIANGQDELWRRVRREIDAGENCAWNAVHPRSEKARLEDILSLLLVTVPMYQVRHNRFMFEAAKIPAFAKFLRQDTNCDLCNYVSNPVSFAAIPPERYSNDDMRKLGQIVNATLGIEDDWF